MRPSSHELCGDREYQKEAVRTTLRFCLGWADMQPANAGKETSTIMRIQRTIRVMGWDGAPDSSCPGHLSALWTKPPEPGRAMCCPWSCRPSCWPKAKLTRSRSLSLNTIEDGLLDKFRNGWPVCDPARFFPQRLSSRPLISSTPGKYCPWFICVENYHAISEHVGSSIADSLQGKVTANSLVLNDEAHHIANEARSTAPRGGKIS